MEKTALVKVAKIVGTWLPAILLMLVFIPQGLAKFSDTSGWTTAFRGATRIGSAC